MTFKELKVGKFFIPTREVTVKFSKYGVVLMQKTEEDEVCSMSSGARFPVHNDSYILKPNESIIGIDLKKQIVSNS